MFDYAARQARLSERLEDEGIDALFLAPSADLEYLTGVERQIPNFGEAHYAHGWVTGALFRPATTPSSSSRGCSLPSTCARSRQAR